MIGSIARTVRKAASKADEVIHQNVDEPVARRLEDRGSTVGTEKEGVRLLPGETVAEDVTNVEANLYRFRSLFSNDSDELLELRQSDEGVRVLPMNDEPTTIEGADFSRAEAIVDVPDDAEDVYGPGNEVATPGDEGVALAEELREIPSGTRPVRPRDLRRARHRVAHEGKRLAPGAALSAGYVETSERVEEVPEPPFR